MPKKRRSLRRTVKAGALGISMLLGGKASAADLRAAKNIGRDSPTHLIQTVKANSFVNVKAGSFAQRIDPRKKRPGETRKAWLKRFKKFNKIRAQIRTQTKNGKVPSEATLKQVNRFLRTHMRSDASAVSAVPVQAKVKGKKARTVKLPEINLTDRQVKKKFPERKPKEKFAEYFKRAKLERVFKSSFSRFSETQRMEFYKQLVCDFWHEMNRKNKSVLLEFFKEKAEKDSVIKADMEKIRAEIKHARIRTNSEEVHRKKGENVKESAERMKKIKGAEKRKSRMSSGELRIGTFAKSDVEFRRENLFAIIDYESEFPRSAYYTIEHHFNSANNFKEFIHRTRDFFNQNPAGFLNLLADYLNVHYFEVGERVFGANDYFAHFSRSHEAGVCGHIHSFVASYAAGMGIPSWTVSSQLESRGSQGSHMVSMHKIGDKFVLVNYGERFIGRTPEEVMDAYSTRHNCQNTTLEHSVYNSDGQVMGSLVTPYNKALQRLIGTRPVLSIGKLREPFYAAVGPLTEFQFKLGRKTKPFCVMSVGYAKPGDNPGILSLKLEKKFGKKLDLEREGFFHFGDFALGAVTLEGANKYTFSKIRALTGVNFKNPLFKAKVYAGLRVAALVNDFSNIKASQALARMETGVNAVFPLSKKASLDIGNELGLRIDKKDSQSTEELANYVESHLTRIALGFKGNKVHVAPSLEFEKTLYGKLRRQGIELTAKNLKLMLGREHVSTDELILDPGTREFLEAQWVNGNINYKLGAKHERGRKNLTLSIAVKF